MNDIPVASQFNTFKANIGITIFDSCQGTFNKYFKMSPSNAKDRYEECFNVVFGL
jgi:hypothetical protein